MKIYNLLKVVFFILSIVVIGTISFLYVEKLSVKGAAALTSIQASTMGSSVETPAQTSPQPAFDPTSLNWEEAVSSAPWESRDSHAVVVYDNKIWLMGGLDANGHVISPGNVDYDNSKYFSDVWSSTDGVNWNLILDNAPWGKRRSIQLVNFEGKMWLMGGWGPEVGYKNDVWSSTDGVNWKLENASAAWPAREGHQLVVFQNKIWLIGGVRYDKRQLFNDVWSSSDGINWVEATYGAAWSPRWDHAVEVFNNKLWLIDGMVFGGKMFKDVWYSDDGANWVLANANPPFETRQGNFITDYKGSLWVIGRLDAAMNGGVNDVWYSDDGIDWQKTKNNPLWLGREDFGAVVFKDKIWVIGGMDRNWEWTNDVWYSNFNLTDNSLNYPEKTSGLNNFLSNISQIASFFSYIQQQIAKADTDTAKKVEVDISKQKMEMFEGKKMVNEFSVSTGSSDTQTPTGSFKIYDKFVMVRSDISGCWLPFWVGFTKDGLYGFHEVPICDKGRLGSDLIGKPASLGCVRLSVNDSEAFYKWIEVGTPIIIKND